MNSHAKERSLKTQLGRVRKPTFRTNFVWAGGGNAVYMLAQWGVLVALARFGSPAEVGRYAFGLAIAGPIVLFTSLVLGEVLATDTQEQFAFSDYLGLRLVSTLVALLLVGLTISALGVSRPQATVVLLVALAKGTDGISDIFHGLLRKSERMDYFARGLIANGVGTLAAVSAVTAITHSAAGAALGSLVGSAVALIAVNGRYGMHVLANHSLRLIDVFRSGGVYKGLRITWNPATFRKLAWICLPLGIMTSLNSLGVNIPRYFIEHKLGEASLGLFSAITYIVLAVVSLASSIGQSASPRLATYFGSGDVVAFRSLLLRITLINLALSSSLAAFAFLFGRSFLALLYGTEYAGAASIFRWTALASLFVMTSGLLNYAAVGVRRFKALAATYVLVTLTITGSCALLIGDYGLMGAVAAGAAGAIVQFLGCSIIVITALRAKSAKATA